MKKIFLNLFLSFACLNADVEERLISIVSSPEFLSPPIVNWNRAVTSNYPYGFSDCAESAIRNFLNFILLEEDSSRFNLELLPAHVKLAEGVEHFYKNTQPTTRNVFENNIRNQWAEVIAKARQARVLFNPVRFNQDGDLKATHLLPALNYLLGLNVSSYHQLATELNKTNQQKIIAQGSRFEKTIKNKKIVWDMFNNTGHAWVEIPNVNVHELLDLPIEISEMSTSLANRIKNAENVEKLYLILFSADVESGLEFEEICSLAEKLLEFNDFSKIKYFPNDMRASLLKLLLALAIKRNSLELVTKALDYGASPNLIIPNSCLSIIYLACVVGNLEIVRLLLSRGGDPNMIDCYGYTVLRRLNGYWSCPNYPQVLQLLKDYGAVE